MNDDLTFSPVQYSTEERIKGNKTQGFRSIPLTPQAQEIITKTLKLNPDGDFLFMKDGQPIYADSFNEHLKNKVCEYSCAVTPQVRQTGNRLSGLAGTAYASLLT